MKPNAKNSNSGATGSFGRLVAEKKKSVAAICLIAVMVLMWGRVLIRKNTRAAGAETSKAKTNVDRTTSDSQTKVSFVDLPNVKGRNDVLTRDFFASNGWENFKGQENTGSQVSVLSKNGTAEQLKLAAQKLELQAIYLGKNSQAFINDKRLSVGDKFTLKEGQNSYECEVAEIEESKVLIRCEEANVVLSLSGDSRDD